MLEKFKQKATEVSKDTIKAELKKHYPEIVQGATLLLLTYICIRVSNGQPINVNVTVNGGTNIV